MFLCFASLFWFLDSLFRLLDKGKKVVSLIADKGKKVVSLIADKGRKVVSLIADKGRKVVSLIADKGRKVVISLIADKGRKVVIGIIATYAAVMVGVYFNPLESIFVEAENVRPNIVVVLIDDMDVNSMNVMLKQGMMPALQSWIIDHGTTFNNTYVSTPLCCPSRATLLTGHYAHNHNVLHNSGEYGGADELDESTTVAVKLKEQGYITGYIGKYLNSYGSEIPKTHIPPGWDRWNVMAVPSAYNMYDFVVNSNGNVGPVQGTYQVTHNTNEATEFIHYANNEDDSSPFLLYVSTLTPHAEVRELSCQAQGERIDLIRPEQKYAGAADSLSLGFDKPSFNEQDVSDKGKPFIARPLMNSTDIECIQQLYQARIEAMKSVDDLVNNIMVSLQTTGELDNSVVFFLSDNGFMLGEHRYVGKFWYYEESIRIPFYATGKNFAHSVRNNLVLNNDLAPTMLDIAGLDYSGLDGKSLMDPFTRDHFLIEGYFENQSSRAYAGIHTGKQVYIERWDGANEYYDLEKDPYQVDNLVNSTALEPLRMLLEKIKDCKADQCP